MKLCLDCGIPKSKKGKYCKKCGYKHRIRPSGLKYNIKVKNSGWGLQAGWNKGKHGIYSQETLKKMSESRKGQHSSPETEFKKGLPPWNKGKEFLQIKGEKHPQWKGDQVGYNALHAWVRNRLKKPDSCENCTKIKPLDLANSSGKYLRDLSDWEWLCRKCHHKKDQITKKGWKTRKKNIWLVV